jgi:hypothetical protein
MFLPIAGFCHLTDIINLGLARPFEGIEYAVTILLIEPALTRLPADQCRPYFLMSCSPSLL